MTPTATPRAGGVEGAWPTTPRERSWGPLAVFGLSVSTAVATWCFLIGGYVAYYLPAASGTLVMIAGGLVGILLIFLALVPVGTRYGVDSIVSTKPQLGERGSYLALLIAYITLIGWNTVLLIFLGRAAAEILITLGVFGEGARQAVMVVSGLVGVAVVWWLLRGGPERMRNVGPWIASLVILLGIWIFVLLVKEVGWSNLMDARPSAAAPDKLWNYTTGFELLVVSALSWWPYVGGMARQASGGVRRALWPALIGLSLPLSIVSVVGLLAGLAVPDSGGDPTTFLVDLGGVASGIPALLFIVLANIGTVMVGLYAVTLGVRQVPAIQRHQSWSGTLLLSLVPVAAIIVLIPNTFFDNVDTLLAFMGVVFAPMCGMQIADYYLLRRQRLDVRSLFVAGGAYRFWGGVNPAGVLALASGFVTYLLLLDPVNYTSNSPYEYISASLPSAFVAAVVYLLVTRLVVIPAGKGGYPSAQAAERPVVPAAGGSAAPPA